MDKREQRIKYMAIHEAGHIVVAFILDLDVNYAQLMTAGRPLERMEGYTGLRFPDDGSDLETPAMIRRRAIQTAAGMQAERFINKDKASFNAWTGTDTDWLMIHALKVVPSWHVPACIDGWDLEAHALLRTHWTAVLAIADYLLAHQNERVDRTVLRALFEKEKALDSPAGVEIQP